MTSETARVSVITPSLRLGPVSSTGDAGSSSRKHRQMRKQARAAWLIAAEQRIDDLFHLVIEGGPAADAAYREMVEIERRIGPAAARARTTAPAPEALPPNVAAVSERPAPPPTVARSDLVQGSLGKRQAGSIASKAPETAPIQQSGARGAA